ncbi:MAG: hypothetical protein NC347_00175 [Clostridium sp.]|nr:hypothetical protein [Clostridium sp.]
MQYLFLFKLKDSNDRDCCAYLDKVPSKFVCGHYFAPVNLHGSQYCIHTFPDYDQIDTFLCREEYNRIVEFRDNINNLGMRITPEDERYQAGISLIEDIQDVYDKLASPEAEKYFEDIQEGEKEYLKDEYDLSDEDIEDIWDEYAQDYKDRSIVNYVYANEKTLGQEYLWGIGYLNESNQAIEQYINFESLGKDLVDEEEYISLRSGRIASVCY